MKVSEYNRARAILLLYRADDPWWWAKGDQLIVLHVLALVLHREWRYIRLREYQ